MKKILFLAAFPPNRLTAGQNYSRELLNSLSKEYSIDLICFSFPDHRVEINSDIKVLKIVKVSKVTKIYSWLHLPFLHPFFVSRFRVRLLLFLCKNSKQYDFIYFDFSQVFIYSLFIRNSFKIFMCHDIIYEKLKRDKYYFLNPFNIFLFMTEKLVLKSADLIVSNSPKDKLLIKKIYKLDSSVANIFINENIKSLDYDKINLLPKFCFFGAWNRSENWEGLLWFLNKVFPYINTHIKFEIIGPGLDLSLLNKFEKNDRIHYCGFLDNPYLEIAGCYALIAPVFQGAGVKVKVLESLATGTPVIGTEMAFEGVSELGNSTMFLCTTAEDFINAINKFPGITIDKKKKSQVLFDNSYPENTIKNLLQSVCMSDNV